MSSSHPLGPTLELIRGGRTERVYELSGADLYIGRIPGMDVYLDDARVSRHHARVECRPDGTSYLVDLESKSCTQLDGQRLTPFQAVPLRNGSRIMILGYELIFRDHALELSDSEVDDSTILEKLDDLSTEYLAKRSVQPVEALKAILEINRALGGGAEMSEVLGQALDALMAVFVSADRGFILIAGRDGTPRLRALRQRSGRPQIPVLSRTVLGQVMQEGKAILIKDTAADPRFVRAKSVVSTFRTALSVPLPGHDGRPLGMVQLDRRTSKRGFKAGDLDLLAALAVPVGVAVENDWLLKERAIRGCRSRDPAFVAATSSSFDRRLHFLGMLFADTPGRRRPLRLHRGQAGRGHRFSRSSMCRHGRRRLPVRGCRRRWWSPASARRYGTWCEAE